MSEVICKELKILSTSELKRRYDEIKSKISDLEKETTLIYKEYRRREVESKRIVKWMEDCIK